MINVILFYAATGAAGWTAHKKRWGWCVVFCLIALRNALKVWA